MAVRAKKVTRSALILLAVGALYALFVTKTQLGIPCLFRLITGWQCPGCGVSRMCLALLRLDFRAAFRANAAIFCLLPLMGATTARLVYLYIRYDRRRDRAAELAIRFLCAVLVVFGILRNLL